MATRKTGDAEPFLPEGRRTLPKLREAAAQCRGCDLYRHATQTVFGEGSTGARIVFVGEQPGDMEDRQGRPFVGPAGRAMPAASSARSKTRRGQPLESTLAKVVIATAHPSSILRAPDEDARHAAFEELVEDLRVVAKHLNEKAR